MKYNAPFGKLLILPVVFAILFGMQSAIASTRYTFTCPNSTELKKSFFRVHVSGNIIKLRNKVPQAPLLAKGRLHKVKAWGSLSMVAIREGNDAAHQMWCGYGDTKSGKDNAVTIKADVASKEASCFLEGRSVVCIEN